MMKNIYYYYKESFIENIRCEINSSVGEFIDLLNSKPRNEDKYIRCAYLRGQKLDNKSSLKEYYDDLENIPLFVSNGEDEPFDICFSDIIIDLDDYTDFNHIGEVFMYDYFTAKNKKTGNLVNINIYKKCLDNCRLLNIDMYKYSVASTINHPGIIKVIGFRYPLNKKQKTKIHSIKAEIESNIFNIDVTGFVVVLENTKNIKVDTYINEYLKSPNESIINPTIRSKIIFGIASIMKFLHKKGFVYLDLSLSDIYLDENLEPKIYFSNFPNFLCKLYYRKEYILGNSFYNSPEINSIEDDDDIDNIGQPSDVFSYAIFLFRMFSDDISFRRRPCKSPSKHFVSIGNGLRYDKSSKIPEHYWQLIEKCWKQNPYERLTFEKIVEILKNDEFALEENGMKTDLDELHEYQERIDKTDFSKTITPKETKSSATKKLGTTRKDTERPSKRQTREDSESTSKRQTREDSERPSKRPSRGELERTVETLKEKVKKYEHILSINDKPATPENYFVDQDDEEFHKNLGKIGEGATSVAYKIVDTRSGQLMCKKILKTVTDQKHAFKILQNTMKEFQVLYNLHHPCICRAIGINTAENSTDLTTSGKQMTTIALFLEFQDYSIDECLEKMNNTLKTKIIIEIAHAMNYIHKKGLIHRDLKIDNIRLNCIFEAKIIDFGLIRIHESLSEDYSFVSQSLTKGVGTLAYMSPEMLNEEDYDYKTDVFSFGIVLYYIFVGSLPKQNLKEKVTGKTIKLPDESPSISKVCIDLISKCLSKNPKKRPSFEDILKNIRENSYLLADYVDKEVISRRDCELQLFEA